MKPLSRIACYTVLMTVSQAYILMFNKKKILIKSHIKTLNGNIADYLTRLKIHNPYTRLSQLNQIMQ